MRAENADSSTCPSSPSRPARPESHGPAPSGGTNLLLVLKPRKTKIHSSNDKINMEKKIMAVPCGRRVDGGALRI